MPAFTPNLNLYKPGGGSTGLILPDEVADIDRLNQNFDLIDDYAGEWGDAANRVTSYRGTAAGISSVSGMQVGDLYQETNENRRLWRYDGSNWQSAENGTFLIRPESAVGTNVSIESDGSIKLDGTVANTYVGAKGVFSTRFRAYKILYRLSGATQLALRLSSGDTVPDASTYVQTYGYVSGTSWTVVQGTSNAIIVSNVSSSLYTGELTLYSPADAASSTVWRGEGTAAALMYQGGGTFPAGAYDGIRIATAAASTGWIRILGIP